MRGALLAITAAVILALQGWALDRTAAFHSDTVDESTYLAGAARLARYGRDRINREQPPLTKWLVAGQLKAVEPAILNGDGDGWDNALWDHPPARMMRNLLAARRVNVVMTLLTGLLLFGFMLRCFGPSSALIALVLWGASPLVMAHGALATMEAAATMTTLLVVIAFWAWWRRPGLPASAGLGLAWALAMLAKSTALILPIPAVAAVLWRMRGGWPWRRPIAQLALTVVVVTPLLVWSAYRFQVVRVMPADVARGLHDDLGKLVGGRRILQAMTPEAGLPVPLYDHLSGIGFQAAHARGGHHNFLDGEVRHRGWWSFYLRSIGYETPLLGLLFALCALAALRRRDPVQWALLALPAWWLLYFSLLTPAQGGLKYMLPALPLWLAFMARELALLSELDNRRAVLVSAGLCLLVVSVHRVAPNYLMFFNSLAGGPSRGWAHLVHGKDWGQGQRQLAEWMEKQGHERIWYARYSGNPKAWGLRFRKPPCEPVSGWVAAHVSELQRPERHKPIGCLDWLKDRQPVGHFAHAILLWHIKPSDLIKP